MQEPPPMARLPPLSPAFYLSRSQWNHEFREIMAEALQETAPQSHDLLRTTLQRGTPLNDEQLLLVLSAPLFFGGVFSTASVLATTLFCLVRQTADYQAVADAARQTAAGEPPAAVDHALFETMRLWPPVPLYFRNVDRERPTRLGGHSLPANTLIMISNWLLHRDASHWGDGESYRPGRWADGGCERDPLRATISFRSAADRGPASDRSWRCS